MPIYITVDDAPLHAALGRLMASLQNTTPAMRALAGIAADAAERAFAKEADPATGTPWTSLARSTQALRARKGREANRNKLQMSGRLAGSIGNPGRGGVLVVENNYALVGTNVVYAPAHQFGGVIQHAAGDMWVTFRTYKQGRRAGRTLFAKPGDRRAQVSRRLARKAYAARIPARPFMGLSAMDLEDMLTAVKKCLLAADA